ncbi:MAG: VOC family protein [Pseudacidovorax sp.]|nr:VOC family protein [Pseudacidovorax sp.]
MTTEVDHLVVAAASLDQGIAWCEATLGLTPGPGGAHPLMGTHNRLLALAGAGFARCYLEIIAIDPAVRPTRAAGRRRWFDLDDGTLQASLAQDGPRLVHWVARVPDVQAAVQALAAAPLTIDRGPPLAASRETAAGLLQWRITVRDDGQRLFDGALPTLIEWGERHPAEHLPPAGLELLGLGATQPDPAPLQAALAVLGLGERMAVTTGAPGLQAHLSTPSGVVVLDSRRR